MVELIYNVFLFSQYRGLCFLDTTAPLYKKKEKGIRVNGLTKDFELLPNAIHG